MNFIRGIASEIFAAQMAVALLAPWRLIVWTMCLSTAESFSSSSLKPSQLRFGAIQHGCGPVMAARPVVAKTGVLVAAQSWLAKPVALPLLGVALTRRSLVIIVSGAAFALVRILWARRAAAKAREEEEQRKTPEISAIFDFGGAILGALGSATVATVQAATEVLAQPADEEAEEELEAAAVNVEEEEDAEPTGEEPKAPESDEAVDEEPAPFIPAPKFDGAKPGYIFKSGPEGKGYYNRDYDWV